MSFYDKHVSRDYQRAANSMVRDKNLHPNFGRLFRGRRGVDLFGVNLGGFEGTYPEQLQDLLPKRIESITDQPSEWYSELRSGHNQHRQQLIQQMVNEFDFDEVPNIQLDDTNYRPTIDDKDPSVIRLKYVLPLDKDCSILAYALPTEFLDKCRLGMQIDVALPSDITGWTKLNQLSDDIKDGHALVLTYEIPIDDKDEIAGYSEDVQRQLETDLDWLRSLLKHCDDEQMKHRDALVRGVTLKISENIERYSQVYDHLPTMKGSGDTSVIERRRRSGAAIFRSWLVDAHGNYCQGCNRRFCVDQLEVDHIDPWSKGGKSEFDNLQLMCGPCNRLKADDSMEYYRRKLEAQGGPKNDACCDGNH